MKKKQIVRLTESDLHRVINESVKKILKEDEQLQLDFENGANENVFVALPVCVLDFSKLNFEKQMVTYGKGLYGFHNLHDVIKASNAKYMTKPQIIYQGKNIGSEAKNFGDVGGDIRNKTAIADYKENKRFITHSDGEVIVINPRDFRPEKISMDNGKTWFECII